MKKAFQCVYDVNPIPASRPRLGKGGAFNTKRYTDYKNLLIGLTQVEMANQKFKPFKNMGLYVDIIFTRDSKRRCDLDNLAKGVLDAITQAGLIDDDNNVWELNISKQFSKKGFISLDVREIF